MTFHTHECEHCGKWVVFRIHVYYSGTWRTEDHNDKEYGSDEMWCLDCIKKGPDEEALYT
jgi:hypothetical protein